MHGYKDAHSRDKWALNHATTLPDTCFTKPPLEDVRGVPGWAQDIFPGGLNRLTNSIWEASTATWNLAGAAKSAEHGLQRGSEGPEVSAHYRSLLQNALSTVEFETAKPQRVLELQCGNGRRSINPLLNLLPHADIVAADGVAFHLVTMMKRLESEGNAHRVLALRAEPEELALAPGSIDLISGVDCLHEREDPDQLLWGAARALREGGIAIFLAPFDGHGILRLAYDQIRSEAALRPEGALPQPIDAALARLSHDIASRTFRERSGTPNLQQKWLFARESLEQAAHACGFHKVQFIPHHDHPTLYRDFALAQLRNIAPTDADAAPEWALDILASFDQALPPPVKRLLMLEGTIILTK